MAHNPDTSLTIDTHHHILPWQWRFHRFERYSVSVGPRGKELILCRPEDLCLTLLATSFGLFEGVRTP